MKCLLSTFTSFFSATIILLILDVLISKGEKNEEKEKEIEQEYCQTCDWIKKRLGDKVGRVQISNRYIHHHVLLYLEILVGQQTLRGERIP